MLKASLYVVSQIILPQNDVIIFFNLSSLRSLSTTTLKRNVDANRLLRTRSTFSRSLMVSIAVSKLGCTELFFVEPGVNVNGEYYRNVLLMENMLPAIWGCQATSSSSRTAPQHVKQRTPLRCCDVKHQASLDQNSGQQTPQTSIQLTTEFGV